MHKPRTIPQHRRAPQRQRGLLGLLAALTVALRKGMAACESDAPRDTPLAAESRRKEVQVRATALSSEPLAGGSARPSRGDDAVSPLQQAALDLGVAFGCYVKQRQDAPERPAAVPIASASEHSLPRPRPASPLQSQ